MAHAIIFLIDGFEEIEAISTIDVLRRANVEVTSVSLNENSKDDLVVLGKNKIKVFADIAFSDLQKIEPDMIIIPGGTIEYLNHVALRQYIISRQETKTYFAAICAAPSVYGMLGLLKNKKATCFPGIESYLEGATIIDENVVVDKNFITSKGPATSIEFALTLVRILSGENKEQEIRAELLFKK